MLIVVKAITLKTSSDPIDLPKACRLVLRRKNAMVARIRTIRVVTLIPPAVEVLPPPTNIRVMVISAVLS